MERSDCSSLPFLQRSELFGYETHTEKRCKKSCPVLVALHNNNPKKKNFPSRPFCSFSPSPASAVVLRGNYFRVRRRCARARQTGGAVQRIKVTKQSMARCCPCMFLRRLRDSSRERRRRAYGRRSRVCVFLCAFLYVDLPLDLPLRTLGPQSGKERHARCLGTCAQSNDGTYRSFSFFQSRL